MSEDLVQRVLKSIATSKRIPLETVTIDSSFEQLNIDSMDAVEILFVIENEFDCPACASRGRWELWRESRRDGVFPIHQELARLLPQRYGGANLGQSAQIDVRS